MGGVRWGMVGRGGKEVGMGKGGCPRRLGYTGLLVYWVIGTGTWLNYTQNNEVKYIAGSSVPEYIMVYCSSSIIE